MRDPLDDWEDGLARPPSEGPINRAINWLADRPVLAILAISAAFGGFTLLVSVTR